MKTMKMKLVAILACFVCGLLLIFNVSAAPKSEQHNAESYAIMITDFSDFMLVSDIAIISQMELSVSIESSTYRELSYIPLDNIYTTNYTPITCAIAYLYEYTELAANMLRESFMEEHPTFVEIYENSGLASTQFNCHSYAWYNASAENPCWIRYPDEFIDDPHCLDITNETDVQEGDIVVFYNGDVAVHSAKVDSITYQSGDWNIECVSKFHDEGIYLHNIDETSDVYTYDDYKFYRYTQGEHFLSIDEDNGESGHTFVCTAEKTVKGVHKTCSYTTECVGEFTVTSVNSSYHRIYCSNCYYSEYVDHDLYMYSAAYEDYVVKCYDCSYTIECTEEPEYIDGDETGHWVDCTCGCYSFYEEHDYIYMPLLSSDSNRLYYHIATCRVCTGTHYLAHNWVNDVGGEYMCTLCGVSEDSVPGIMSLPDPELEAYLASLSGEELEEFIASLPEDQVERVTALLPSDDEHLTE